MEKHWEDKAIEAYNKSSLIEGYDLCKKSNIRKELTKKVLEENLKLKKVAEKYNGDFIKDLSEAGIDLVKPASIGAVRGKRFERLIESEVSKLENNNFKFFTQIKKDNPYYPEFLKKDIAIEIPDLMIVSPNKSMLVNVQIDLWCGGAQTNRGEKYHSTLENSLYHLCKENGWDFHTLVYKSIPPAKTKKETRGRSIIRVGRETGIMLYLSELLDILRGL